MNNEIWKDIKGYEGLYQVSNLGRVKSLTRYIEWNGTKSLVKGRILKQSKRNGYLRIQLMKKNLSVHRLVAEAFIDNPNNYPIINHKDENPLNNNVENLEWCNYQHNNNYGTRNIRMGKTISKVQFKNPNRYKPINQIDIVTNSIIKCWMGAAEIERVLGINRSNICSCCKGRRYKNQICNGYKWEYA